MRSEEEIFKLIVEFARHDDRIRAVMLNGSRANPNAKRDVFQDFDVVYFVAGLETFTCDHDWIDVFGERIILQMPDQMTLPGYPDNPDNGAFAYLMLFKDRNRIDLTLFPVSHVESHFIRDSLSIILLDKDHLFPDFRPPDESDYLIQKPSAKQFADVCNEFWWVMPYVAKGLARGEISYAKDMLENLVRKMFMKLLEWQIGLDTNFSVNFGKSGKNLKRYVEPRLYEQILATYADARAENIWKSVFIMTGIFEELAKNIAGQLGFTYNNDEGRNVLNYLKAVKALPKDQIA